MPLAEFETGEIGGYRCSVYGEKISRPATRELVKTALVVFTSLFASASAWSCDCPTPDLLASVVGVVYERNELIVLARVESFTPSDHVTFKVLESFKGSKKGTVFSAKPVTTQCGVPNFRIGEQRIVLESQQVTPCSTQFPSPALVEALRTKVPVRFPPPTANGKQPLVQQTPPGGPPPEQLPTSHFPDCSKGCNAADFVPRPIGRSTSAPTSPNAKFGTTP